MGSAIRAGLDPKKARQQAEDGLGLSTTKSGISAIPPPNVKKELHHLVILGRICTNNGVLGPLAPPLGPHSARGGTVLLAHVVTTAPPSLLL